jgi:hypothetical protein
MLSGRVGAASLQLQTGSRPVSAMSVRCSEHASSAAIRSKPGMLRAEPRAESLRGRTVGASAPPSAERPNPNSGVPALPRDGRGRPASSRRQLGPARAAASATRARWSGAPGVGVVISSAIDAPSDRGQHQLTRRRLIQASAALIRAPAGSSAPRQASRARPGPPSARAGRAARADRVNPWRTRRLFSPIRTSRRRLQARQGRGRSRVSRGPRRGARQLVVRDPAAQGG